MIGKKAFTLVELIISIALLAIIGIVVAVQMNSIQRKNNVNDYDSFVNKIISAADVYASSSSDLKNQLETSKGYVLISVSDLISDGLLSADLVNPDTGETLSGDDIVKATLDSTGLLKFTYNPDEVTESYLETQNKVLEYNSTFSCQDLSEWGTVALRLIDLNGNVSTSAVSDVITNVTCDVDTSKPGTYEIVYTYKIPENSVSKSLTRKVTVSPSLDDIVSISASVSPSKVFINNAISFTVTAKNRKGETLNLTSSQYSIDSAKTNVAGSFTSTIKSTVVNSDRSVPTASVTYTVIDNLSTIITDNTGCTTQSDGSCIYIGNQNTNNVTYSGQKWRIYQKNADGSIKLILNDVTGSSYAYTYYYDYYYCNPAMCCNSGYGLTTRNNYYLLSQNPNNLNTYLNTTFYNTLTNPTNYLVSYAYNLTGYSGSPSYSATQYVGLLSYSEYSRIASCSNFSCSSSYLSISKSYGLSTYYQTGVSTGLSVDVSRNGYHRMVTVYKNQSLYVESNNNIYTADGAYYVESPSGYKASYSGVSLNVRPVIVLKPNVKITSGDGSTSNPFTVG